MIFTRIKRGAVRTAILTQHKLSHYRGTQTRVQWRTTQKMVLSLLAIRTVFLLPLPTTMAASSVPLSSDSTDPLPSIVRINSTSINALTFTQANGAVLAVQSPALAPIAIGKSVDTQQAEAAAEKAAADAAAAAKAAQDAADAAKARASAATTTVTLADAQAASVSYSEDAIKADIRAAADMYGVSYTLLYNIAMCESGLNPLARNHGGSSASGLFQFMPSTFLASPAGEAGRSIWDPRASAEAAAYKVANGGLNAWYSSQRCWGNKPA